LCTTLGVEVVDLVWPHGAAGRPDPRPLSPRTVVLGELPKAHIDAVVKAKSRAVRECYVRDSAFSRRLAGRVTLVFVIAPTGLVDSARVKSTTFAAGDVEACTLEVFRALKFDPPKRGGSVRVTYPFIFTPG
jgi:TonB family protein